MKIRKPYVDVQFEFLSVVAIKRKKLSSICVSYPEEEIGGIVDIQGLFLGFFFLVFCETKKGKKKKKKKRKKRKKEKEKRKKKKESQRERMCQKREKRERREERREKRREREREREKKNRSRRSHWGIKVTQGRWRCREREGGALFLSRS